MMLDNPSASVRALAQKLATLRHVSEDEAIELALRREIARSTLPLADRLRPIQDRIAERPATGQIADKRFFDELSDS